MILTFDVKRCQYVIPYTYLVYFIPHGFKQPDKAGRAHRTYSYVRDVTMKGNLVTSSRPGRTQGAGMTRQDTALRGSHPTGLQFPTHNINLYHPPALSFTLSLYLSLSNFPPTSLKLPIEPLASPQTYGQHDLCTKADKL